MPKSCVLFRVDAGPHIGLGHLQRCLSLATALCHFGADCLFLTNRDSTVRDRVTRFGFEGYTLDTAESWCEDDLKKTLTIASSNRSTAIVVDSDYEGAEYLNELRNAGFFVCAIEDMATYASPCQLVVNGDAHAGGLRYQSSSGDTLFLLGPEYSILAVEFWKTDPRVVKDAVENILVSLGGADPYNLTPRILDLLKQLPGTFSVTAIIGPFFNNIQEVEGVVTRAGRPISLVHSPDSMCKLMLETDLAVSAGGQTLYELACVGCPTVALRTAANQDGQLQVFEQYGSVRVAGRGDDYMIVDGIADAVMSLLPNCKARTAMSVAGQGLVDGQGALRVAEVIIKEVYRLHKARTASVP